MVTQGIEHVLCGVTAVHQRVKLQKTGAALNGVEATEDGIEQITVFRVLFQVHQLFGEQFQDLPGLHQEVLENLFVCIKCHATTSLKSRDWTAGRQRRPVRKQRQTALRRASGVLPP